MQAWLFHAYRVECQSPDARHDAGRYATSVAMGLGDFFRDYGTPFASAVAVLNGFIAVLIAQLFQDYPTAKVLLVTSAGLLGAAAICATFYTQRQIVATRDAEAARRLAIREGLGSFVAEGNDLKEQCRDATKQAPLGQACEWANRVEAFLSTQLGQSYVNRFRNSTGVSLAFPAGLGGEHLNVWNYVYSRLFRLEQFRPAVANMTSSITPYQRLARMRKSFAKNKSVLTEDYKYFHNPG